MNKAITFFDENGHALTLLRELESPGAQYVYFEACCHKGCGMFEVSHDMESGEITVEGAD